MLAAVEVLEGNEVTQQGDQAHLQAQQLVQIDQATRRLGHFQVKRDQFQQATFYPLLHQLDNALHAQAIENFHLRFGRLPGKVGVTARRQLVPLTAADRVHITQYRPDHMLTQRLHGRPPGRVDGFIQRQGFAVLQAGQRQCSQLPGIRQVQRRQPRQLSLIGVHDARRARVERDHLHPGEIIVNLLAQRADCRDGLLIMGLHGQHTMLLGSLLPAMDLPRLVKERLDAALGHRRLATAVLLGPKTGNDIGNGRLHSLVGGQRGRYQPITIGFGGREQRCQVFGIRHRQHLSSIATENP